MLIKNPPTQTVGLSVSNANSKLKTKITSCRTLCTGSSWHAPSWIPWTSRGTTNSSALNSHSTTVLSSFPGRKRDNRNLLINKTILYKKNSLLINKLQDPYFFPEKQRGFSLIELMIVLVINSIIFIALMGLFSANLTHYNKTLKIARLNQQMQTAMLLMTNEIRRAGYWGNANNDLNATQSHNPFTTNNNDISVSGSCILFTYDHNYNGSPETISTTTDDEHYGFRLNNQTLQTRPQGVSPFDCNGNNTSWENVTDPNVVLITSLGFTLDDSKTASSGGLTLLLRSVDITMTGQLTNDTTITQTLTQHVRIRNDKLTP